MAIVNLEDPQHRREYLIKMPLQRYFLGGCLIQERMIFFESCERSE
ncbi:hypothetical protein QOZ95_001682 [Paenibacillus brasilensis]|uniref:Uncharacterized protein n=1 Tax=Paenibacillus brasilensis TaxID=128574 RepID=A0ABU0KZL0_9BACL|nr:hypothetical protein [Paenibacillus brasilensis]